MNKKILVVDDDQKIVELLRINLEGIGYQVSFAYDGEKALIKVVQDLPDLIILDLMLPGMDGYEICNKIRMWKATHLTPIIIISAKDKSTDKIECLKLGANDYITKPFDINELMAKIDSILRNMEEVVSINPLTKLPGNVSIMNEANKRIANSLKFAFVYLDINNFKSYNDKYGYNKGDEIIKFTSNIINQHIKENDFVGHIGGDDYILICDIEYVDSILKRITDSFDVNIPKYYDEEDRQKGHIVGKDRQGKIQTFPIMALSIGIVTNERQDLNNYAKIVEVATEMKNFAKKTESGKKSFFAKDKRESDVRNKLIRKILIVEDNLSLQTLLRVNLEAQGYEVRLVNDGGKAISEFHSFNPDIVILDMILPGISGIDVCQEIRKTHKEEELPILLMSGVYKKLNFRLNAKNAGATDVITKPFEINDFIIYIDSILSKIAITEPAPVKIQAGQPEKPKIADDVAKRYSVDKKVVVHYPDGKIIKGTTAALNPNGAGFNMTLYGENRRVYVNYSAVSNIEVVEEF